MERVSRGPRTYVIQTTSIVAVGDDLDSGIGALGDVEIGGDGDSGYAELSGSEFLDGWQDDGVEAVTDVVADGENDLEQVFGVAQLDGDGQGCQRDGCSVLGLLVAAAREGRLLLVIVASGSRE